MTDNVTILILSLLPALEFLLSHHLVSTWPTASEMPPPELRCLFQHMGSRSHPTSYQFVSQAHSTSHICRLNWDWCITKQSKFHCDCCFLDQSYGQIITQKLKRGYEPDCCMYLSAWRLELFHFSGIELYCLASFIIAPVGVKKSLKMWRFLYK